MHSGHENFLSALRSKQKVSVRIFSKADRSIIQHTCAPVDFGPTKNAKDKKSSYHFWDYDNQGKPQLISLLPSEIKFMTPMRETFEPSEFVTWKPVWHVERDWGDYS